jgi:hypothetical protein
MACEIEDFDEELDGIDQELPGDDIPIEELIEGCKDPLAINYNELADIDDPCLCEYLDCPEDFIITDSGVVSTLITRDKVLNPVSKSLITTETKCLKLNSWYVDFAYLKDQNNNVQQVEGLTVSEQQTLLSQGLITTTSGLLTTSLTIRLVVPEIVYNETSSFLDDNEEFSVTLNGFEDINSDDCPTPKNTSSLNGQNVKILKKYFDTTKGHYILITDKPWSTNLFNSDCNYLINLKNGLICFDVEIIDFVLPPLNLIPLPPRTRTIKEECCRESIVGQPVFWDGEKCLLETPPITETPDCPDFSELQYIGDTVVILSRPQGLDKPIGGGTVSKSNLRIGLGVELEPTLGPVLPDKIPDPCDIIDEDGEIIDSVEIFPEFNNLSEECCLFLGEEFGWQFIDDICYWNPPKENIIEVGISETDIIIDRECYQGNYIDVLCIDDLVYKGNTFNGLSGIPQETLYNNKPYYIIEIPEETQLFLIWNESLFGWMLWENFSIDEGPSGCILQYQTTSNGEPTVGYGVSNVYSLTTWNECAEIVTSIGNIKYCQQSIVDDEINFATTPLNDCCDNIVVNLAFYLEKPNAEQCIPEENVTVSIGFYQGNNVNDDLELTTTTISSFDLSTDGYCNWTNLSTEILNYSGEKFKLKLIIEGLNECCDYDFYVDDISVDCIVQDTVTSTTPVKCPGFKLKRVIDNKKSWVYNDGEIINREFAPSPDADIPWRYTNYFEQSGIFEKHSNLVLNSKEMELTFNLCSVDHLDEKLNIFDLIDYKNNFQSFWVKFIEQFVPATTIFVAGEKWCTTDDKICETYSVCGYEHNFNLVDLGLITVDGGTEDNGGELNIGGGESVPVNESEDEFDTTPDGDYGDNNNPDGLIVIDNFIGAFIPNQPFTIERMLTLRPKDLDLLNGGRDEYLNKFSQPVKITI